jgi:hypothetical protein
MSRVTAMIVGFSVLLVAIVLQTPPQFIKKLQYYHKSSGPKAVLASTPQAAPSSAFETEDEVRGSGEHDAVGNAAVRLADPFVIQVESGGPLKMRSSPDGAIVGVIHNGETVEVRYEVSRAGRKWAFVKVNKRNLAGFLEIDRLRQPNSSPR